MSNLAKVKSNCSQPGFKMYAKGGAVHSDEKMDRALIKKAVKKEALTGKKCGGKVGKK
jgi:hypothetical protein